MRLKKSEATINEGTTPTIHGEFWKITDQGTQKRVCLAELTAVLLTYYNVADGSIINSRNDQNILNANNVTIYDDGSFKWELQTTDTIIVDSAGIDTGDLEAHVALFEWTTTGNKQWKNELRIFIRQLLKV